MKFFFPDSQDLVDPSFDFDSEHRSETRVRQRDDLYAHEIFPQAPYDGLLVSKSIVEGNGVCKYSLSQRHRFRRSGVHEFLRANGQTLKRLEVIGDCGAFNYVKEKIPPYTVEDVLRFYEEAGFDYGISVDHVILDYEPSWDINDAVPEDCRFRQELTLELAQQFINCHRTTGLQFEPIAVAQGWSPHSYAKAVDVLQKQGYTYIALGGMVPLKTNDILACLELIAEKRVKSTRLHLLGISRLESMSEFMRYGVASVDSTSPLKMAFKDNKHNYFAPEGAYTAIRVAQLGGNRNLARRIQYGEVSRRLALRLEADCLMALRDFQARKIPTSTALDIICEYEQLLYPNQSRRAAYERTLEARPWERCVCQVCKMLGYHVVLFRGAERNKRRGFHNLHFLHQQFLSNRASDGRPTILN